jgi:chitin disaccharide deacetylase
VKSVIINADDFGASALTNAAVLHAHTEGVLTSASLMVNEPAASDAVCLARECPSLAVGLHLALSDGRAALPHSEISLIADSQGRFTRSPALAGIRYFFRSGARRQVESEVAAQFGRFADTGLPWSHVDGHQHLHVHPVVWDAVVRQCEAHGVRAVRIPNEEFRPVTCGNTAARRLEWLFFRALRKRCLRTLQGRGFTVADRVYGHVETGAVSESYLLSLLPRLAGETNEIYLHPGTPHARPMGREEDRMDVELHALLSAKVHEKLKELDMRATTYAALASAKEQT